MPTNDMFAPPPEEQDPNVKRRAGAPPPQAPTPFDAPTNDIFAPPPSPQTRPGFDPKSAPQMPGSVENAYSTPTPAPQLDGTNPPPVQRPGAPQIPRGPADTTGPLPPAPAPDGTNPPPIGGAPRGPDPVPQVPPGLPPRGPDAPHTPPDSTQPQPPQVRRLNPDGTPGEVLDKAAMGLPAHWVPNKDGTAWVDPGNPTAWNFGQGGGGTGGGAPGGPTLPGSIDQALLDRINRTPGDLSQDPNVRRQSDAFSAAQERARRAQLADSAESASAQGAAGSGAARADERMINEQMVRNVGQMESELVGRELAAQRDETMQALAMAIQKGDAEQARALQERLGVMNADIQRLGITESSRLGMADMDLRRQLGMRGLDLEDRRLGMADRQFGQRLGYDYDALTAEYNDRAMREMML